MPEFYIHDDLDTWLFVSFTEEYERADHDEQVRLAEIIHPNLCALQNYASEAVDMAGGTGMLAHAICNSFNYEEVYKMLRDWEKKNCCWECKKYTEGDTCDNCNKEEEDSGGE